MVFTLGRWDNYQHLEDSLSLDELYATAQTMQETEYRQQKFAAAMKGIDLDKETDGGTRTDLDRVKERVERRLRGEPAEGQEAPEDEQKEISELAAMGLIQQKE